MLCLTNTTPRAATPPGFWYVPQLPTAFAAADAPASTALQRLAEQAPANGAR
jgi:hypothetical protein